MNTVFEKSQVKSPKVRKEGRARYLFLWLENCYFLFLTQLRKRGLFEAFLTVVIKW